MTDVESVTNHLKSAGTTCIKKKKKLTIKLLKAKIRGRANVAGG